MSFSMPRAGIMDSIAAHFSTTAALSLVGSSVTLTAQLYSATPPSNIFTPVAGASVNLSPQLTGMLNVGAVSSGLITGLNIPVAAGTRLILVFSAAVTAGLDIATVVIGYASAGVGII
jgi:BclB C-terminal domain-containing protein